MPETKAWGKRALRQTVVCGRFSRSARPILNDFRRLRASELINFNSGLSAVARLTKRTVQGSTCDKLDEMGKRPRG